MRKRKKIDSASRHESTSGRCQSDRSSEIASKQGVNRLEAESQRHASDGGEAEKRNYRRPPEGEKKQPKKPRQHSAGVITFKFAGAAKQEDH